MLNELQLYLQSRDLLIIQWLMEIIRAETLQKGCRLRRVQNSDTPDRMTDLKDLSLVSLYWILFIC
jgi:hypothetical protein